MATDIDEQREAGLKHISETKAEERQRLNKKVAALHAEGLTRAAIATRLGCSPGRVALLLKNRPWKARRT